jgi:hypothetical protein
MDVGVVALIALNNMLFAFLIWALPRPAVVLAVALGLSSAFLLLHMPSLWLSLEAGGYAALATAVLVLLILADVLMEVVASAKAYLAASAVAGLLAGTLLAVAVVATAVPEIATELGVSVEETRVLYSAVFGAAVGDGFAMFVAWLLAALLWWFLEWWFLEDRVDLPRPLLLVAPGFLAAAVFLALAFFQAEPKDAALVAAAALAASPAFLKLKEEWTRQL